VIIKNTDYKRKTLVGKSLRQKKLYWNEFFFFGKISNVHEFDAELFTEEMMSS
jgi:hypothetical protein